MISCPLGEVAVAGLSGPVTGSCRLAASWPYGLAAGGSSGWEAASARSRSRLARAGPACQVMQVGVVVSRGHGEQPAAVRIRLLPAAGAPGGAPAWASCGTVPSAPQLMRSAGEDRFSDLSLLAF